MKNNHPDGPYIDTGLSPNMEDYMETITILAGQNRVVRVKDIASKLNITMPSVSSALTKLKEMELIEYEKYGHVELTDKGKQIADSIYRRHSCLKKYYMKILGLDADNAEKEACKVEHILAPDTFERIESFLDFFIQEEKSGREWLGRLKKALGP